MFVLDVPNDCPVMIFAVYRSGSTALCDTIANKLHYKNFHESYHGTEFQNLVKEFQEYKKNHNSFVCKIFADQINNNNKLDICNTLNKSYKIRLLRRNLVHQICSWYISVYTNFFHQTAENQFDHKEIKLDFEFMESCCHRILWNNCYLQSVDNIAFNSTLYYEDLQLDTSKYQCLNKPDNYRDILNLVKHTLLNSNKAYEPHPNFKNRYRTFLDYKDNIFKCKKISELTFELNKDRILEKLSTEGQL